MATVPQHDVATDETGSLISADKVTGTAVYDTSGERLGSIHTLMIDKRGGNVVYAVLSFGGFLGFGDRYHPLPWSGLTYDTRQGGYVIDATREQLKGAPSYAVGEEPDWSDTDWDRSVQDYYRQRPGV